MLVRKLSELLHYEVDNPKLKNIVVSKVTVSRDLNYAKVFFTPGFGYDPSEAELKEVQKALRSASSYLRKLLAASCQLRVTPALTFVYDASEVQRQHMSDLIDEALTRVEQ